MKKLIAIAIAFAFLTTFVGLAAAQAPTTKPADKPAEKMEKKTEKAAEKKAAAKNANGTVKSARADSIVVAGKEKGKDMEWTFAVDPKTKIKKAGKDVTAGDLKAGDAVHVRYTEDAGKAMAQTVTVKAGGKDMKAEKKAANPCAAKAEKKPANPCAAKTEKK